MDSPSIRETKNGTAAASDHGPPPPPDYPTTLLLVRLVLLLLVAFDELAPRLRADRPFGLPDDVELAVLLHFADVHGLPQMVVLLVHLDLEAVRRHELLAGHRRDDLVGVGRLRLLDGLLPHVDADVRRFHRI